MLEQKHILTDKDFEFFKDNVEIYLKKFFLSGWDVVIEFDTSETPSCFMASSYTDVSARVATVVLYKVWEGVNKPTSGELDKTALHEVLEIMLSPLTDMMSSHINPNIKNERTHSIIHKLIKNVS